MEKGYRYFGTDLTPGETPDEAGLGVLRRHGRPVHRARGHGARRARAGRAPHPDAAGRRQRVPDGLRRRGRPHDGASSGRLRSASYGFTVERNLAYAYLPVELETGDSVGVEMFGELVAADVVDDVQYDPGNERVRS